MKKTFMGFPRPNESAGIRNWTLVLPVQREVSLLGAQIASLFNGTKVFLHTGEGGRPEKDRQTVARTVTGIGMNPNVASVLVIGMKPGYGYEELDYRRIAEQISSTGKPVRTVVVSEIGGAYNALGEGVRLTRELVIESSKIHRVPCDIGKISIGVKCGMSDPTSGLVGNRAIGQAFDMLVDLGGTVFFSETTEIIGAEHLVAKRAVNSEVGQAILDAAHAIEEKAKRTGEDIRRVNPIPSNIASGITTLEEKSLGAIAKAGTSPIMGVLQYGERPAGKGLYFVDSWMSSLSLPLCYAACGAQLVIYQMGGGDLPAPYPLMPATSSGVVSPLMYVTGNRKTYEAAADSIDFDSSPFFEGKGTMEEISLDLFNHIIDVAEGSCVKMEPFVYQDPVDIYLEGPNF